MSDQIVTGKSAAYRAASEALHRDPIADRQAARFHKLWECGFADLIRADFYGVLGLPEGASGNLLDAGCGTGIEAANLQRLAPGLKIHGVDISSVSLAGAVAQPGTADAVFYQAALERLPFADGVFDYITAHEVIEHVEDPAVVLCEFSRVLKPGGVCAIATPNGASWWIEHLRQRVKRAFGRRGAPVGEDHTRPPSFWRREFVRAGFVVQRQIFDAAAIEFQTFVAPARWMPVLSRALEPLRALPGINLVLCDRVKYRLLKSDTTTAAPGSGLVCCPICRAALSEIGGAVLCADGHRFVRNSVGLVDFSVLAPEPRAEGDAGTEPFVEGTRRARRSMLSRRARRFALLALSTGYAGCLLLVMPLGMILGIFHQPFRTPRPS
ncbi:MAG TPA: class I SAM-dependent methyltransferase [Stellaceae bacterium]